MSIATIPALLAAFAAIVLVAMFVIWYAGKQLAGSHGSDIRIVWYLFSLAVTSTLLIGCWASSVGVIDASGGFHGSAGALLHKFLEFMLDLEADLKILGTLVALVVAPQLLSYVLSSLFGCAVAPILVGPAFRFFFWSVVKSLVVAAGIVLVVGIYGWTQGWDGLSARKAAGLAGAALMLLTTSFALLYLYREFSNGIAPSDQASFIKLRRLLHSINAWANRRITSLP